MFLLPILIWAYNSPSLSFLIMCSAYRLNKQVDRRQPCQTPFCILNQSVVPYRVLTVASWPAYRFLRRQLRWSGIPIPLRAFYSLLWSTQSKALAKSMKQFSSVQSLSRVRLCGTPETAAHQVPPFLEFSRQEHWSGLPFLSPTQESEEWKWSHSVMSDS